MEWRTWDLEVLAFSVLSAPSHSRHPPLFPDGAGLRCGADCFSYFPPFFFFFLTFLGRLENRRGKTFFFFLIDALGTSTESVCICVCMCVCVWGGGSVFTGSTDARRRERAKEMGTIFVPLYRIKLSLPLLNEEF